ncbi:E3 ubiquitin-protein ligase APD2-like isoform X2 [Spinacia oleracea]|uniref:E3 ubiquitin-protein ligase APD2-like isoform X2 n=1 Tax=Spinacia oleracea TaxID=3562 RepID=A0A9R0JA97_SPIOL|nr:E3 ubiquitin-protein ligase APD2-like isoform X2 [Spinacia oleracea]
MNLMNPKHLPDFFHKMEEQGHITTPSGPSPITHDSSPSSSSPPPAAQPDESEETEVQQQPWRWQPNYVFHCFHMTVTSLVSDDVRNDAWSCLIVLLTFWFFASMILIIGFYGPFNIQLGPNSSFLIETNPFFVDTIKAQQTDDQRAGSMLYGFHESPSLNVETTWSQNHTFYIDPEFHKELAYYLNAGSRIDVSYDVKFPGSASLSLVIAQGRGSLLEWIGSPSYPNTTMSWNIINGKGKIAQDIKESDTYFVGVGNLNLETAEVYLNITIMSILYNTTNASFKCLLRNRVCSFKLILLKPNAAVLTSPGPAQVMTDDDDWYVQVSFGPQWVTYCGGSCIVAALILVLFRYLYPFQSNTGNEAGNQVGESVPDRQPLLSPKNNDHSSWGSSYDSIPSDEDQGLEEKMISEDSIEGEFPIEGEIHSHNTRRLCAICFDAPRDCFFLPCGHCAACFSCGSRIAEEAGICPICRRKMKKVRKIFSV